MVDDPLAFSCCRFMMVGDPFSGKTKVLEVLAETLNILTDRGYDDENVNKVKKLQMLKVRIDHFKQIKKKNKMIHKDLISKQVFVFCSITAKKNTQCSLYLLPLLGRFGSLNLTTCNAAYTFEAL